MFEVCRSLIPIKLTYPLFSKQQKAGNVYLESHRMEVHSCKMDSCIVDTWTVAKCIVAKRTVKKNKVDRVIFNIECHTWLGIRFIYDEIS